VATTGSLAAIASRTARGRPSLTLVSRKRSAADKRKIAPLLKGPVGRPSRKPKAFYHSFRYRAGSWECARRVVAKVEWHAGELFPRVGFLVTNLERIGRLWLACASG
jgi:hypothetical protein